MAAERATAAAVLVFNSVPDGDPSGGLMEMGGDGGAALPTIPAILVSQVCIITCIQRRKPDMTVCSIGGCLLLAGWAGC